MCSHTGQQYSTLEVWADQTPIGIGFDGLGIDFTFLLMNPSLLFAMITALRRIVMVVAVGMSQLMNTCTSLLM